MLIIILYTVYSNFSTFSLVRHYNGNEIESGNVLDIPDIYINGRNIDSTSNVY